ncbi:prolipoprotein diacylglyceryl transferase [Lachnotalea glycerini]|nr:prolipoprotein diacylglyceryl transferase [Lachnotalea glycerini]
MKMYNNLLKLGPVTVHSYGLLIGIGFMAALIIADYRSKKKNLDTDFVFNLAFVCIIFGMLGAKVLYLLTEIKTILNNPVSILDMMNGFVVYGGIIAGTLAAYLYCKIKKKHFLTYFDLLMPSVAIAQGFGRIGCFFAGCCYGLETSSHFSVVFKNSQYAPNHVHLIPTQLISSGGDFLIGILLIFLAKRNPKSGIVASAYLILYGIGRFAVEFLRGDLIRGSVGSLSTSQFISIFIVAAGFVLGIISNNRTE